MSKQRPPVIGVTRCGRLDDYVTSVEKSGATARVLEVSESPRALVAELDGVVLTGGGDVDPAFYGEARHPRSTMPSRDATSSRSISRAARWTRTCRSWRSAAARRSSTSPPAAPSCRTSRRRSRRTLTHSIDVPKDCVAHDVRIVRGLAPVRGARQRRGRRVRVPGQQPAPSIGRHGSATGSSRPPRRRTASSKASSRPRPASASACSGTRRISGAPASSGRCSMRSWAPRESDWRREAAEQDGATGEDRQQRPAVTRRNGETEERSYFRKHKNSPFSVHSVAPC